MDEVHHWVGSNGGPEFFQTLKRNVEKLAKAGARWVTTTNAYNPTEDSVAQQIHESEMVRMGLWLYDCLEGDIEPDELRDEGKVRQALKEAYGDATWADLDGLTRTILYDRTTPDSTYLRFFCNRIAESSDGWMSKSEWDARFDDQDPIEPGDQIAVGFDGSIRGDSTCLVGCRLRDGKLFVLGLWEHPRDPNQPDWEVDVLAVEARVAETFRQYRVEWMYADPPYWQENIGRWALEWGDDHVFEFWTNKPTRMVQAVERFRTAAMVGDLRHDGNEDLTRHVLNAVVREVPQGFLITKDSPRSRKKIDAAVSAVLAFEARADAIADGRLSIRRSRVVGF